MGFRDLDQQDRGAGADFVAGASAPDDTLRMWKDGDTFPRMVLDPANSRILVGSGSTAAAMPLGGGVINAAAYGIVADGVTDDTTAVQAAMDATPAGGVLVWPIGTILVSATLLYDEYRTYIGAGYSNGTTFKLKSGTNLATPIFAFRGWYNSTGVGFPVQMRNFAIDGNKANNGSGTYDAIGSFNFESDFRHLHIFDCMGNGIWLTDKNRSGTTPGGTIIEQRIQNNWIERCNRGIYVDDLSGAGKLTDGFCIDNIINSATLEGIRVNRGAGWRITGNHSYSSANLGTHGIFVDNAFCTRVSDNYIDNYGQTSTGGLTLFGIRVDCSATGVSPAAPVSNAVTNNTIRCTTDNAGGTTTYRHLSALGKSGLNAACSVTGNSITGSAGANSATEVGLRVEVNAAANSTFDVAVSGNQVSNIGTAANRFQMVKGASGVITGQFDCYGTGTPESVVTAAIGSTYRRIDGGAATSFYVKETGTAATGWVGK